VKKRQRARAVACANIALAKYWGKNDVTLNLPAVPSISLTLDGLVTETTVEFLPSLDADEVFLDDRATTPAEAKRVVRMLDRVRADADLSLRARVKSKNHFPTASGLASSASGFAALAAASTHAAGLTPSNAYLSRLSRWASASAGRSIYGGFVKLPAGIPGDDRNAAKPVADRDHWDVRIVVAVTAKGPKDTGSTDGMERSRKTSPFYEAWVEAAPKLCARVERGIKQRDLELVGRAMEQSTMAFHACAFASDPAIIYFQPPTLAALATVRALRAKGVGVYATMDAGPHVKALCHAKDAQRVRRALAATEGVIGTIVAKPGPGIVVS
jgi:diphosphomevalonate decarboxylase